MKYWKIIETIYARYMLEIRIGNAKRNRVTLKKGFRCRIEINKYMSNVMWDLIDNLGFTRVTMVLFYSWHFFKWLSKIKE